jgi:hypothetical protein
MAKFGIGVGEEFPVDEPANPPPPDDDEEHRRRRHWRLHHWLHLLTRVAVLALIVSAIVWMFRAPHFYPYAADAVRPYPHHFFFRSFRSLLIVPDRSRWRRHGCCYGMRRHWHHEHRGDHREEV